MSSIATKKIDQVDVNGTKQPLQIGRNGEITIGTDSSVQLNGQYISPYSGFRNRIINGDMRIDQRNAGASVTPATSTITYTLDRWLQYQTAVSKFSVQRNAGSVALPSGFTNYLGITSLSSYSSLSSDAFLSSQYIEGFNTADLAWGTASAATVTLSFWVRSSLTGTFSFSICNAYATRNYIATYTVSTANTWEYKTITVIGDASGTWSTDNGIGLQLRFDLGSGSGYNGTAGSWGSSNLLRTSGSQSIVGTSGATFYITGVQLEKGSVATPFEFRPYGMELSLCQRYYRKLNASSRVMNNGRNSSCQSLSTIMRATPSYTLDGVSIEGGQSVSWQYPTTATDHFTFDVVSSAVNYTWWATVSLNAEL